VALQRLAVVTGATAGIGAAFARRLATAGYDLVLVARDGRRLTAVADELNAAYGTDVSVLAVDLATETGCAPVARVLRERPVKLLVNNAGIGLNGDVVVATEADELRQLRLNVQAVLLLTRAALPGMAARGGGGIINVSSIAGFAALSPGSTYPASKAWVTNFSLAADAWARRHGVRVLALCPGYTRTEFHQRAGIATRQIPAAMWSTPEQVVATALQDLRLGRRISVPGRANRLLVTVLRHLPTGAVMALARSVRGSPGPVERAGSAPASTDGGAPEKA
jgi:short-subunit dehydrogenase